MKHFNFKSFVLGIGATVLVAGLSVTALAATGTISYNQSAIKFNGVIMSDKGANYALPSGVTVPASITYTDEQGGGTTYLPARRISEMMGIEIGYDAAAGAVSIGEGDKSDSNEAVVAPPAVTIPNTPIRIKKVSKPFTDSAGGVGFSIRWNNQSDKGIKYIRFYITPYNRVNDVQYCDITSISTIECYSTGPFLKIGAETDWENGNYVTYGDLPKDGEVMLAVDDGTYSTKNGKVNITNENGYDVFLQDEWDCVWYNYDIDHLVVDKVKIEYMDGSSKVLQGAELQSCFW